MRGAISKIAPEKHLFAMGEARKPIGEIILHGAKTKIAPETVADTIAKALMRGANLKIAPETRRVSTGFPFTLGAKCKIAP